MKIHLTYKRMILVLSKVNINYRVKYCLGVQNNIHAYYLSFPALLKI